MNEFARIASKRDILGELFFLNANGVNLLLTMKIHTPELISEYFEIHIIFFFKAHFTN